jgi:hypothetical protein
MAPHAGSHNLQQGQIGHVQAPLSQFWQATCHFHVKSVYTFTADFFKNESKERGKGGCNFTFTNFTINPLKVSWSNAQIMFPDL